MIAAVLLTAVLFGTAPTAAGDGPPADELGRRLVRGKCQTCHSLDYLAQQRLTAPQWEKTVDKMRKFGAAVSDEEARHLAAYLAGQWPADAPETRPAPVKAPRGALAPPPARPR